MPSEGNWLFFVDTNVFLDFYRYPGEPAKRQLDGLLKHRDSLIVTEQLHMEYLRNRQKVIADNLKKSLASERLGSLPSLLADSKFGRATTKADRVLSAKLRKLQSYADNVLVNPGAYDSVYRTAVKIFRSEHAWNLKRPNKLRYQIRERAQKRFSLGYPPRKPGDTSMGDAVNWEWIVHCAINAAHAPNILIVSRDGDYGVTQGKTTVLNDWLKWEFKNRVKGRRKIELTTKLTDALRKLDELVTDRDEEIEDQVINSWKEEPDVRLRDLSPDSAVLRYVSILDSLKPFNIDDFRRVGGSAEDYHDVD